MIRPAVTSILIVLFSATWLPAQDVSEKADGIICRQPECDIRKSLSENLDAPLQLQQVFVERVKNMPASVLDSALPEMPFESWLFRTLQLHLSRTSDHPFASWSLSLCAESASAFPQAGPDFCVEISVPVVDGKIVRINVRVASRLTANGQTGWQDIVPVLHDIYIERGEEGSLALDSLDVTSLPALEDSLRLPFDEWPTIDLKTQVTWSPGVPKPGEVVQFTFSIANAGRRDAERAEVVIYIAMPLNNEDLKEIRRYWFPRVPAGKAVRLDISATLGRGDATIVLQAAAKGSKRVREVDGEDNEVIAEIPLIR